MCMSLRARIALLVGKILSSRLALALLFMAVLLSIKTVVMAAVHHDVQPLGEPFDEDENLL